MQLADGSVGERLDCNLTAFQTVSTGDLSVTIVITAISVGLSAGVGYYKEH